MSNIKINPNEPAAGVYALRYTMQENNSYLAGILAIYSTGEKAMTALKRQVKELCAEGGYNITLQDNEQANLFHRATNREVHVYCEYYRLY